VIENNETPGSTPPAGDAGAAAPQDGAQGTDKATGDLFGDGELPPLTEPAKRKRGRPRKKKPPTERAKRERKKKHDAAATMLDAEIDKATATAKDAERGGATLQAEPAAAPAAAASASDARNAAVIEPAALTDEEMRQIIGLGAFGISRMIPPAWGGGALSDQERELIGRVWWAYLKPMLSGEGSPLVIALAGTLQVFALRAVTHAMTKPAEVAEIAPAQEPARANGELGAAAAPAAAGSAATRPRGLAQPVSGGKARKPDPV
jgi:hypothetical protein